jgi:hypothetical protein
MAVLAPFSGGADDSPQWIDLAARLEARNTDEGDDNDVSEE